ncbi:MAG: 3-oxoacyl-[acyl-carrier-protein] reductase [Lentisphaeria bacterium]
MSLQGKVAIVTGGTRGIGKAISIRLARDGAKVIAIHVRPEAGEEAQSEFAAAGVEVQTRQANISDVDAVNELIKSVIAEFDGIDILVNNAGITRDGLLVRIKEEDWDAVMNINLKGTFNCIKAVTRPMMKARSGRILSISSVVGVAGNAGQANYAASKAGIIGLTKSVAKELASRNVTANCIAPGYIDTDMTNAMNDEAREQFLTQIPLGRPGSPDEVAGLAAYLVSDEATYITGQTICIDGGMIM